MIDPKELRLGNYVNHEIHGLGKVESFSEYQILYTNNYKALGVDLFKPIPINEQWLLNFGFYKDEMGYWSQDDSIYSFVDRQEPGYMLVVADNEFKETYVKSIHKIQNLWYFLTKQELKL